MSKNSTRARMLATAVTALSAALATQAQAAEASVTTNLTTLTSTVIGSIVSGDGAAQTNSNSVSAGVVGSTITTTVTGASTGSFVNSTNTADALAFGNRNGVTVSLATISSSGTADGIGVATVSLNSGAITASAINQDAGAILTGFTSGSVEVAGNSIDATTTINDGAGLYATSLTNSVPVGYSATSTGAAQTGSSGGTAVASGTLVVSNTQVTASPDSSAVAGSNTAGDNNTVVLTLGSTADNSVTASAVLDSNNVGATFTGNSRTGSIGIAADTGSFAGTAAIANTQMFDGNTTADNALNQDSQITATVAGTGFTNSFSASSLSVGSNAITSAASGNVLSGAITLADALSYNPTGANVSSSSASLTTVGASADLVIGSEQRSLGGVGEAAFLSATTDDAVISATVQESLGSSVAVSANRVTAAVTNNSLTTSISSGDGSALFDGSAALGNNQLVGFATLPLGFATTATVSDTQVRATLGSTTAPTGEVAGGSASVDTNIVAASAIGNSAAQTIDLNAADLVTSTGLASAGVTFDDLTYVVGSGGVSGAVTIGSSQTNWLAPVTAQSLNTSISLASNDALAGSLGADLAVTGNIQQAFAQGSTAGNSLTLTGVSVDAAAGINNTQLNYTGSTVTATQTGTVVLAQPGSSVENSATLSGNRSEAIAMGVNAANSLTVNAATAEIAGLAQGDADGTQTVSGTLAGPDRTIDTQAAYASFNFQQVGADVTATATGLADDPAFAMFVGNGVIRADVVTDSNRLTAQAQGAVVANAIDLNIGTINVTGATETAPVGSLMNVQVVNADVLAQASPEATASPVVVQTRVNGSVVDSSVSTSANRVTAIADGAVSSNMLGASGADLSVFDAAGGDAGLASASAGVYTTNAAFSVINAQTNPGPTSVTATLFGVGGDSATVLTGVLGQVIGGEIASDRNQLTALASSLETSNSLTLDGTTLQSTGALLNLQQTQADVSALIGTGIVEGVVMTIGSTIVDSSLSVAGNSATGQALGNVASNTLTVSATSLAADGANLDGNAQGAALDAIANADFALANAQSAGAGSSSVAAVSADFALDQTVSGAYDIVRSSVALDGNAVTAEAMANTATNALGVTATNIAGATAALASTQGVDPTSLVQASSVMDVYGNIESTGSTITLDGNSNRAIGVINNASNSLSVAGTNVDGIAVNATAGLANATGSFAVTNVQSTGAGPVGPTLQTTAITSVFNNDNGVDAESGVFNGAVSMSDNLTFAESSANRAANSLSVAGAASNAAPAALSNDQDSTAAVSSTALAFVSTVVSATQPALNAGSMTVADNATQSLARGNTASNTMLFTAGADYGTPTAGATADGTAGTATAAAAMLNRQSNSGSVIASASATYEVALNSTAPAVLNGAVSVSGNSVAAQAFGNQATNRMELAVLNSGNATAAFNNVQTNSGAITAQATNVRFTSNVSGAVTNGAFRNVGNAASAAAVGNSSVTSIIGR